MTGVCWVHPKDLAKGSLVGWQIPVVSGIQAAEAEGLLEPRNLRSAWADLFINPKGKDDDGNFCRICDDFVCKLMKRMN